MKFRSVQPVEGKGSHRVRNPAGTFSTRRAARLRRGDARMQRTRMRHTSRRWEARVAGGQRGWASGREERRQSAFREFFTVLRLRECARRGKTHLVWVLRLLVTGTACHTRYTGYKAQIFKGPGRIFLGVEKMKKKKILKISSRNFGVLPCVSCG